MQFPTYKNELDALANGHNLVAGCDEVGVGPLAGPVVAAAVIIDPKSVGEQRSSSKWYYRVRDSKTTNEAERLELLEQIKANALTYGIGEVQPNEIDQINIHKAKLLAMKKAVLNMLEKIENSGEKKIFLFLDGKFTIKNLDLINVTQKALIAGDALVLSISAASIIAKVYRDNILKQLDLQRPEYGFGHHKGYGTKKHQLALAKYGPSEFHRKSFL